MPSGLSFNLFGIPIRIDASFFLVALFVGLGVNSIALIISWVVVVTISVLAHELGHAITFRVFDRQPNVVLQWLGGVTYAPGGLTEGRQLIVSLAGPLTGLLLIGLPALILAPGLPDDSTTWGFVLTQIVWVNIFWSLVNLVPILPLDGGQVAASVLHFIVPSRAMRLAHMLSVAVAVGGAVVALMVGPGLIFVALFAAFLAYWNFKQLTDSRSREQYSDLQEGYVALGAKDANLAVAHADRVIASKPPDPVVAQAIELKAWARLYSNDGAGARQLLNELPTGATPNQFLVGSIALMEGSQADGLAAFADGFRLAQFGPWSPLAAVHLARAGLLEQLLDSLAADDRVSAGAIVQLQSHLHYAGLYRDGARAGERAFAAGSAEHGQLAYNIACDWALAGEADVAMAWLERAVNLGFATRQQIDDDPDFNSLRADGRYAALLESLPRA